MAAAPVVTVAHWLADQPARMLPLVALGALVRAFPEVNRCEAARAVLAALDELDKAGLVRFAHHFPTPVIGVLDPDGLRRVSCGRQVPPARAA